LDGIGAKSLIEETLREHRIPLRAREALQALTLLKNRYLWEAEPNIPPAAVELYQTYQRKLRLYRRWDFDDLIPKMVELWEEDPDWLKPLKRQFRHLLVDEFQDLNLIQYRLIKLWARDSRSLMAIGDPNQSIYGFRGSSSNFFNLLKEDFPEAVSYRLTQNFRSSATVIKGANRLIPNEDRQSVQKKTNGESDPKIIWFETPSEKAAAQTVADQIIRLLGGSTMISAHSPKGRRRLASEEAFSLSEVAILYRTGRQGESLETVLTAAGLPYRVSGSNLTLEALPVKEFLTFFRYLCDPTDLFWLRSALRCPRWNLRGEDVTEIIRRLEESCNQETDFRPEPSLFRELPPELALKLEQFLGVADYYREQLGRKSVEVIEDWMIRMDTGSELELEQLKRISENYGKIEEMLRFLPLAQEADLIRRGNKSTGTEMITLSTLHAAKGLEFPVVFIIGVEEGLIPYGDDDDSETIAEEQRLFYVGMTRAKRRLYLVNSQFRFKAGAISQVEVSRFLRMLPSELLEKVEWTKQSKGKQLELF
jgi:superfamily I DNA/RNA helicase